MIKDYMIGIKKNKLPLEQARTLATEKDAETKESLLVLTKLVYETNKYLLDILAIDVPDKI